MLAGRAGLIGWCHYLLKPPGFGQAVWKGEPRFGFSQCFGSIQRGHGRQWRSRSLVRCGAGLQHSLAKQQLLPEFRNSQAGSKALDEGTEQGPGPGGLGGGPCSGWAGLQAQPQMALPCSLTLICSCRGCTAAQETAGEQRCKALKWAAQQPGISSANPRPKISLLSINSNLFALSGTNLKICFKSWLGTWYSVFLDQSRGKQWA